MKPVIANRIGSVLALALFACGTLAYSQDERRTLSFDSGAIEKFSEVDQKALRLFLETVRESNETPETARKMGQLMLEKVGENPNPMVGANAGDLEQLSKTGADLARKFPDSEFFPKFVAHLFSLALELNPDDVDLAYELEEMKVSKGVRLEWKPLLKQPLQAGAREWVVAVGPGSIAAGTSDPGGAEGIGKTQSLIKGLSVQQLDGGLYAGNASQMNATAIKTGDADEWVVGYNQNVGKMMTGALSRTREFLHARHPDAVPAGFKVELSFEDQYVPRDGPSAAVATTLLLESLITGFEIDPRFAVTGDMDKDGKVGRVGGIDGKIRGAIRKGCDVVAIPSKNRGIIGDLLLMEGPQAIANIQIFGIDTFESALELAQLTANRSEDLQSALAGFAEVQAVLSRPNGADFLQNGKVQQKLRDVVKLAPNHLSARFLLLKGIGREPEKLTLSGSFTMIKRSRAPLTRAVRTGKFDDTGSALVKDEFAQTVTNLVRLRPRLDPRTHECADAIVDYSKILRIWRNNRPNSDVRKNELINQIEGAEDKVSRKYDELTDRPDVKEELGIDDEDESEDDDSDN